MEWYYWSLHRPKKLTLTEACYLTLRCTNFQDMQILHTFPLDFAWILLTSCWVFQQNTAIFWTQNLSSCCTFFCNCLNFGSNKWESLVTIKSRFSFAIWKRTQWHVQSQFTSKAMYANNMAYTFCRINHCS